MAGKKSKNKGGKSTTDTSNPTRETAPQTSTEGTARFTAQEVAEGDILLRAFEDAGSEEDEPDREGGEGDDDTVDQAYVVSHPNEQFHHVGNGRFKPGRKPEKDDQDGKGKDRKGDSKKPTAGSSKG